MKYNLRALQVFESVYRNGSIILASKELCITASAISHQLRKLSDQVGERLIERQGRQIAFTLGGKKLGASLNFAFGQIDQSVANCIGTSGISLKIAMCSTFATGWLIKRLNNFQAQRPDLTVQLLMYGDDPAKQETVADGFVTVMQPCKGHWSMTLFDEVVVPVMAPGYSDRKDLDKATLITTHFDRDDNASDWRSYLPMIGMEFPTGKLSTLRCSHEIMALEAARNRLGIALIPTFLAKSDLDAGNLELWSDFEAPSGRSYKFCVKAARRQHSDIQSLVSWMLQEKKQFSRAKAGEAHQKLNSIIMHQ